MVIFSNARMTSSRFSKNMLHAVKNKVINTLGGRWLFQDNSSLVKLCTLDATAMRVRSLFTSFTFCNIIFSCSLISKERIYIVLFTCVSLMELPALINLYYYTIRFFLDDVVDPLFNLQDDLQFEKVSSFDGTMAYAQNKRQQVRTFLKILKVLFCFFC